MSKQALIEQTTGDYIPQQQRKGNELSLFLIICGIVCCLTPLLVLAGVNFGIGILLVSAVAVGAVIVIARWPVAGFFIVAVCVLLIEEEPLPSSILTDRLYVYYWPAGLEGLIERPIGFLFLFILFVIICRRLLKHETLLRGGALLVPFLLFLLCVAGGAYYGWLTGGDLKIIVVELRPFIYLFESYLLAYNLVASKRQIRLFIWLVIICAGIKALQGLYLYYHVLHGQLIGDTLMSHEESFFFAALLTLAFLLSIHYRYRPQLIASLIVTPFVFITLVLNDRRADYIALVAGLAAAWALMFITMPRARTYLAIGALLSILLGGGYIALFSNSTQGFAAPAHAIVAVFNPAPSDLRDAASNQYRIVENTDLKYTVLHNNLIFGLGFGKPYLQPIPLTTLFQNISFSDIYYGYVPHNTIYWIWMRLGFVGFLVFWFLIGSIIVQGSMIARKLQDPYLRLIAIFIVSVVYIEIVVSYADYQLFFYRNVIYVGLLVGILMKLPELDKQEAGDRPMEGVLDERQKTVPGLV
jgi:hypothetical protein